MQDEIEYKDEREVSRVVGNNRSFLPAIPCSYFDFDVPLSDALREMNLELASPALPRFLLRFFEHRYTRDEKV